jgi:hypothetical protein
MSGYRAPQPCRSSKMSSRTSSRKGSTKTATVDIDSSAVSADKRSAAAALARSRHWPDWGITLIALYAAGLIIAMISAFVLLPLAIKINNDYGEFRQQILIPVKDMVQQAQQVVPPLLSTMKDAEPGFREFSKALFAPGESANGMVSLAHAIRNLKNLFRDDSPLARWADKMMAGSVADSSPS